MSITGIVIQARMGSGRLPGKTLLPAPDGRPLLRVLLDRVKRTKMHGTVIVVATTSLPADDAIADVAKAARVRVLRGSEDDVLSRFHAAAVKWKMDSVIRLTGDCPLVDPVLLDRMGWGWGWAHYLGKSSYLQTHAHVPEGLDMEWMTAKALTHAHQKAKTKHDREHVTPYLRRFKQFKPTVFWPAVPEGGDTHLSDYGHIRLSVDYEEDYRVVCDVLRRLGDACTMQQIIDLHDREPALFRPNQHIERNEWKKEAA